MAIADGDHLLETAPVQQAALRDARLEQKVGEFPIAFCFDSEVKDDRSIVSGTLGR